MITSDTALLVGVMVAFGLAFLTTMEQIRVRVAIINDVSHQILDALKK